MSHWYFLSAFIAIGPLYWFGSMGFLELLAIKLIFFTVFFINFVFNFIKSKRIPVFPRVFGFLPLLIIISIIIISGFKSSSISVVLDYLLKYIPAFFLVWLAYNASFIYEGFEESCSKFLFFIPIISLLIVTNYFFSIPNWHGPYYDAYVSYANLSFTGFGATRTGWSSGLALIFPLMLIGGYNYLKENKAFLLFIIVMSFMSVFLPGGRGGIISLFITSLIVLRLYFPKKNITSFSIYPIVIAILFLIYVLGGETRAFKGLFSDSSLNEISSGRIEGVKIGFNIIQESLFSGLGVGNVDLYNYGLEMHSIHNYWIGTTAEVGVLLPLFLLSMFVFVFYEYMKKRKLLAVQYKANFYVLIAGLFMSNLEPGGFIGSLQQQAIFWICLGRLLYVLKYKVNIEQGLK